MLPRYVAITIPLHINRRCSPGERPSQDPKTLTDGAPQNKMPSLDPYTLTDVQTMLSTYEAITDGASQVRSPRCTLIYLLKELPRYEAITTSLYKTRQYSPGMRPFTGPLYINRQCTPGKRSLLDHYTLTDGVPRVSVHHMTLMH